MLLFCRTRCGVVRLSGSTHWRSAWMLKQMCSTCPWRCKRVSYWLPGGHQFLADTQLLRLGSVPVAFVTFPLLKASYELQRDKKSAWCHYTCFPWERPTKELAFSCP